jgi:hypothetical protein
MTNDALARARAFVGAARLPEPPPANFNVAKAASFDFDAAKEQATVAGSSIISFVTGVTPEQRKDILNALLLAQLVAKKKVAEPQSLEQLLAWYEEYFDVLSHVGFVIQSKGLARYQEKSQDFEAHEAILDVATVLLAGAPAALALVKTTLEALKKMSADSPWITVFNRESRTAQTIRFQVSLVDQDENAQLLVTLMAFGVQAESRLTQVLFFKFRKNEVTLHHNSGAVTINADVLSSVRAQIAAKLVPFTAAYIEGLPDL